MPMMPVSSVDEPHLSYQSITCIHYYGRKYYSRKLFTNQSLIWMNAIRWAEKEKKMKHTRYYRAVYVVQVVPVLYVIT